MRVGSARRRLSRHRRLVLTYLIWPMFSLITFCGRMCVKANETINQIVSECTKLTQKEFKRRHDWIEGRSNCEICGVKGIPVFSNNKMV